MVAVVFYRAHELSGNTGFVDTLCAALADHGATPLPIFCASLRSADAELTALLEPADAVITTVLAAGGSAAGNTAARTATGEGDWDAGVLASLDVPVLQGLCLTSSRAQWEASNAALAPVDAAMQVAIPEFDGRLITVPFSFKEEGPDGIPRYAADPERAARLAGIATRHARLARTPNAAKRVAIMLSSYPTKHSRVGNAVGLDTPASAVALLRAMREAGYDLGDGFPEDGDTLIHTLIAAGGHDTEWLTEDQLRAAPARVPLAAYRRFFENLPNELGSRIREHWGAPPGELYTDESSGDIVLACLRFGHVVLMIQPPRGFGENPVAIYHDPDLPPVAPLPGGLPLAGRGLRRRRDRAPGQARHAGVAARQGARPVGAVRAGRGARRPAAGVPVHRQRPGGGHPGQAARARGDRRPPGTADGARRHLRRDGQARAAAR